MSFKRRLASIILSLGLICCFGDADARAATLNVVGGQLLGASGVDVGGTLYNVEFLDGTCIALYDGCDESSDFTFNTAADALLASQSLLDQVFVNGVAGQFRDEADLTNGCDLSFACQVITPYDLPSVNLIQVGVAQNSSEGSGLVPTFTTTLVNGPNGSYNSAFFFEQTNAVWSPVPEPNAALLIGMGLARLEYRGRVKQS